MANDTIIQKGLVSDSLTSYFNLYVFGWANLLVVLFGFASNCINVIVFSRQGLTDSVTIAFFFLSLSDLGVNFTNIFLGIAIIVYELTHDLKVDPLALVYLMCWPHIMFTTMSMYTTVFISVERCLCVLRPLSVKDFVTPLRSVIILIANYVFVSACFVPVYISMGMSWQPDVTTNTTRLMLWLSPYRPEVELFLNVFVNATMHTVAHIIVIICSVFMGFGIQKSSRFRHSTSNASGLHKKNTFSVKKQNSSLPSVIKNSNSIKGDTRIHCSTSPGVWSTESAGGKGQEQYFESASVQHDRDKNQVKLSSKDRKVVKTVTLVVAVFVVCTTPDIWFSISRRLILELDFGKRYSNLHWVLVSFIAIFSGLNASLNMVIYLTTSSRYRQVFESTFYGGCRQIKPEKGGMAK